MLARNVLEHGLIAVDRAAFQRNGQAEQRQEHERDEKRRHRLGDEVEREVKQRGPRGSQDELAVAAVGVLAGEQPLPQHVEPRRSQPQKRAARHHERKRPFAQVDGPDQAAPSQQVGDGGQPHDERARRPGHEVPADHAGEVACREHDGLREEEPKHDLRRLELQRKERKHAAPHPGGVDGQEQRVAERRDAGCEYADDATKPHALPFLRDRLMQAHGLAYQTLPSGRTPEACVFGAGPDGSGARFDGGRRFCDGARLFSACGTALSRRPDVTGRLRRGYGLPNDAGVRRGRRRGSVGWRAIENDDRALCARVGP